MKSKLFRSLLLITAAIALVVSTVFATMAYMTRQATITNTFTVGKITLELRESPVDSNGQKLTENTTDSEGLKISMANKYHLIPGQTYDKDPTVYVMANSEACYLYARVKNGVKAIEDSNKSIPSQMEAKGWKKIGTIQNSETVRETLWVYCGLKDGTTEINTEPAVIPTKSTNQSFEIFNTFTTASNATIDDATYSTSNNTNSNITVTAYSIQQGGFDSYTDAENALLDAFKITLLSEEPNT